QRRLRCTHWASERKSFPEFFSVPLGDVGKRPRRKILQQAMSKYIIRRYRASIKTGAPGFLD
ncbi:MAG: hypothetical protein OSB07_12745, partial [Dehalococcoidia bacterium]|nr:hypothetical protein [Dehalococcoidia bacterium]